MASNSEDHISYSSEETIHVNQPFQIPGLFSEMEGITRDVNSTYAVEVDQDHNRASVNEEFEDTYTPSEENQYDESLVQPLDVPSYINLLKSCEVNPEDHIEVHDLQNNDTNDIDECAPAETTTPWPEELFSNVTYDYEEMFSVPTDDLFADEKENTDKVNIEDHHPLYHNAPLTVSQSLLLVITFAIRHTLSGSALNDLLVLISLHCISPNLCKNSLHQFRKFFKTIKNPLVYHRYCSHCFILIDDKADAVTQCPNTFCARDLKSKNSCAFFIEMPIAQQVYNLFAKSGFYESLSHRFKRSKKKTANYEDIYDGSEYKRHCKPGLLDYQRNLSLVWNTDGAPVFKSSKFSIWPLYFIINELPFYERTKRENMLFAGLWFGDSKPFMLSYLQPFHSSLRQLETDGVKVKVGDDELVSKIILLAGTCDLPAKCLVCNTIQYNGEYGYSKCKQKGETVKVSVRGHVHAFPFNHEDPTGPQRTHEETLNHAEQAVRDGKFVTGIKGPSWFAGLASHDIIKGTAIDYMHGLCLGVMKTLLGLWFATENSGKPFNVSCKVGEADKRLLQLRPPFEIGRIPRSIEHHRTYWKASELRAFLIYYGIPVLFEILDDNYFHHFAVFSQASYILLQDSISENQLQICQRLLEYFCLMFPYLYEARYQTINIHNLLHLPQAVRELGPLWTHSCFHFEDKNGYILKMIHGTQNIPTQIISAVSFIQNLPQMVASLESNSVAFSFYRSLIGLKHNTNQQKIAHNAYALGASFYKDLSQEEFSSLASVLGYNPDTSTVLAFARIKINKEIFHSSEYKKVTARNSYTVLYQSDENDDHQKIGQILFFLQIKPSCTKTGSCMYNCICQAFNSRAL